MCDNQTRIIRQAGGSSNFFLIFLFPFLVSSTRGQTLTLKDAINSALNNYGTVKAKGNYLKASQASVKQASSVYLPNLSLAAQQAYGTANGQFGPVIAIGGLNAASSGPPFLRQNWNAAFGGLYLANISWDFFSFGRVRENVKVAEAIELQDASDLDQEKFQLQVRVSGAYLSLLAAQRFKWSEQKNLERATELSLVVLARTKNGLNAGVDSSQANAEVSSAKIALTNAINYEAEQASQLAQLMGIPYQTFILDTIFLNRIPASLYSAPGTGELHPVLKFYQSRINVSLQQEKYFDRFKYPVFSLVGVLQSRGSGFQSDYSQIYPDNFTHSYWNGVKPTNSNYLLGIGVVWNLTNPIRVRQQVTAQEWTSKGLQNEYELVSQQIKTQLALADEKIKFAIANYNEAPVQMKAASDAFLQKSVLYKNGLTNIVDLTQSLYILNRAETDRDISDSNVWQALLLKAAASGDFGLFENEIK